MIRKILFQVKNEKNYCFSLLENLFLALRVYTDEYGEVRRSTAGVVSFARNEGIKKRRSRRNGDAFSADFLLQAGFFALVVIVET